MKVKHSKYKNTGILFELLTRQLTSDTITGNQSKSLSFLKKHFNSKTELLKEYKIYHTLAAKKYKKDSQATMLIETLTEAHKKLNKSQLRREKYNLIKEIKENYNADDFFNGRISNYRLLASIYNVFQSQNSPTVFNPEETINSKFTILEHITSKKVGKKEIKEKVLKEYTKKDKDLRLLAYQILVDKFNKKYKTLNESQKSLLKHYINNISNTNSLREFVDSEVIKIKKTLNVHLPKVTDEITKIKLTEAVNQIGNLTKGRVVDEKQVLTLMRYYELVKEIENVHKS